MENIEEMRAQFEALGRKLEKQNIISEKMMREVMRSRVSTVKSTYIVGILAGVFVLTFGLHHMSRCGVSTPLLVFTAVMMLGCLVATIYIGRDVISGRFLDGTMLEIAAGAARKRRFEKESTKIYIPVLVVWAAWLVIEQWNRNPYFAGGVIAGLSIGSVAGWIAHRKLVDSYADLIRAIEEFTGEDAG